MASRPNVADDLNQSDAKDRRAQPPQFRRLSKMNVETAIDAIADYCNALDLAEDERWKLAERIMEQMGLNLRQRVSARAAPMAAEEYARLAAISQQLTARVNRTLQQSRKRGGRS